MYVMAYVVAETRFEPFAHTSVHESRDDDDTRTCEFPAVQVGEPTS
jgi:hypothetical protein